MISIRLVIAGALSRFFDIINTATENLVPFVNGVLNLLTEPIDIAVAEVVGDIPILNFVLDLIANLIQLILGEDVSILTVCLSSAITVFIIMHVVAFFNKVVGRD